MFIRIRKSAKRRRLSLIETRRIGGKVRHNHVASLGSIAISPTVRDRAAFWERLRGIAPRLSNRIGAADLIALVQAKVPEPTRQEMDIENLREYATAWDGIANFYEPHVAKENSLRECLSAESSALKDIESKAARGKADAARDRMDRVMRGEDAGLKSRFSHDDPKYVAAVSKVCRIVSCKLLVPDDLDAKLQAMPPGQMAAMFEDMEKEKAIDAKLAEEHRKRSQAAKLGWRRKMRP